VWRTGLDTGAGSNWDKFDPILVLAFVVVEQTIATLWAGVQAVPRLPKSAITKRPTTKAMIAEPEDSAGA
jgi:hypothetical protein